ncbi:UbiA family prenyltransferase [Streptomyces sp. PTM05]|uniref:UbiA family prenyltransferase n=1 Tax=Streptantibioticus parmotrematis TaxID=2873249 RepID=A0ABS7QPX5_9ACTN|nr:UbiA family prenyltransferase [Streptantibioticus parmotrematis]MBY8885247.1 UbiA family prenyltransferase [Streptantibioticus parmotrematis]
MRTRRARALVRLVRAPAALTVPGDVLTGAAASGAPLTPRTAGLAGASVCLYWAGMALNDYADRHVDAVERPERPIPSGQIAPATALGVAAGLTGLGLGLAAVGGGRAGLAVGTALASDVWAYDLGLKHTAAGPAAMAGARALDVLLGACAGGRTRAALPAAAAVAAHTAGVTVLSRGEVDGTGRATPAATLAASCAVATAAALLAGRTPRRRALTGVLAGAYLAGCGAAQLAAVRTPSAGRVRGAVTAGINAFLPLQAALCAGAGASAPALPLALGWPLARGLSRKVSPT